jgi:hypothetical protein
MTDGAAAGKVRCLHCRESVEVSERYAHGDHIRCGVCSTDHKLVRGDRLRLVLADIGPLRDALAQNQQLVRRLEAELAQARASLGIGANGIGIGVAFAVYRVGFGGAAIDMSLLWAALGVAVVSGALLEAANWSFLAKRNVITRLSGELAEAREEGSRMRTQIRDSTRL